MGSIRNLLKQFHPVLGLFLIFQVFISAKPNSLFHNKNLIEEAHIFSPLIKAVEEDVYICKGPGSKRYHYSKSCRGLKSCSTKLYKVKLSEAKRLKRTLCGWED